MNKRKSHLPEELEDQFVAVMDRCLDHEESSFHSDIEPFSSYKRRKREQGLQEYSQFFNRFLHIYDFLEPLLLEEEEKCVVPEDGSWHAFEELGLAFLEKKGGSSISIPPLFLDRVYSHATGFLASGQYEKAEDLFFFLRFFQSGVYEYWLGEATALHEKGSYEQAIERYQISLEIQPGDALSYMQIGCCYHLLGDMKACSDAFEASLKHIRGGQEELEREVKEMKELLGV